MRVCLICTVHTSCVSDSLFLFCFSLFLCFRGIVGSPFFSRGWWVFSIGSTSDGFGSLTHMHGVWRVPVVSCTVEDVLLSVVKVVGCDNIKSASQMSKTIVIFLAKEQFVNHLVEEDPGSKSLLFKFSPCLLLLLK